MNQRRLKPCKSSRNRRLPGHKGLPSVATNPSASAKSQPEQPGGKPGIMHEFNPLNWFHSTPQKPKVTPLPLSNSNNHRVNPASEPGVSTPAVVAPARPFRQNLSTLFSLLHRRFRDIRIFRRPNPNQATGRRPRARLRRHNNSSRRNGSQTRWTLSRSGAGGPGLV